MAYRTDGDALRQLAWFDRTGNAVGVGGEPDANTPRYPELSPDGRFLINQPVGDATAAPITLILNWQAPANK